MNEHFSQQMLLNEADTTHFDEPTGRRFVKEAMQSSSNTTVPTAFLSHSHKDRSLAIGLESLLKNKGIHIYIDWMDAQMPARTNIQTASKIKHKIRTCDMFLFLATKNSKESRWCPWEIGYADRDKALSQIIVIPTHDSTGHNYGNEYLDLYPHIDQHRLLKARPIRRILGEGQSVSIKPRLESFLVMSD